MIPTEAATKRPIGRNLVGPLLIAGLALAIVVACLPIQTLVGVVPDDAFYYLVVGRNIAATGISTFDGQNLASGYHPGWMALVAMTARFVTNGDLLLRIVVAMALGLHTFAGWLLYRCLQRFVSARTAAIAAAFWMFGYLPLVVASFALETSLYCVAFLLSYAVYLGRIEPCLRPANADGRNRIPTINLLLFGMALGLCLWARTEAIVLLACAVGWLGLAALFAWPASDNTRWSSRIRVSFAGIAEAFRRAVWTTAAAFVIILPWFLYCLHTFGTTRQASGVMKMLWMGDEVASLSLASRLFYYAFNYLTWLVYSLPWSWGGGIASIVAIALAWVSLFIAVAVYIKRAPAPVRQAIGRVLPAIIYPILHVVVAGVIYGTFFGDVQCWYLSLPYLEVYIALVAFGSAICLTALDVRRARDWAWKALVAASLLTALGLVRYALTWQKGFWAWQRDVYAAIEPVDRALPIGARVGCFNAGIPGYFSRRQIINLDGLVNNAVVSYWKEKRFEQYLSDAHIGFIYDEKLSMERAQRFSQGTPALEEILQHPLTNCVIDTRFLWPLKPSNYRPRKAVSGTGNRSEAGFVSSY